MGDATEAEAREIAGKLLCAGCGAPARLPAHTDCDCVTNVLFDPSRRHPHAAKDRYFMAQIDTAGDQWPQIKKEMEANRLAVRTILEANSHD
jgi:hypothetical protein